MTNTTNDILLKVEALLKEAALQLKILLKEENPGIPVSLDQEMSLQDAQMRSKATQIKHQILNELVIAAYYNASNPDWDPEQAATYWTELPEGDPLRPLLST